MSSLEGKVALVTGGGRGIGRAIALRLSRERAAVVVNYATNAAAAQALVDEIRDDGGHAIAIAGDIGNLDDGARLAATTFDAYGKVDILVHNAGMRGGHPWLADITTAKFDTMFGLQVRGPVFLTQRIVPIMPDNGRIICISSASTARKIPGLGLYTGSKSALEAFVRVWAAELAPRGITANTISPGAVETDLFAENSPEYAAKLLSLIPMGRFGRPQDIADICAFLASEQSRWLTGITITATGGA